MKRYRKTGGGLLGLIDKVKKPLGGLVVVALILAAYTIASADALDTYQRQANEYEQLKQQKITEDLINDYVNEETDIVVRKIEPENKTIPKIEVEEDSWTSLGYFTVTAYCACESCCGIWADEAATTASGVSALEGKTIAVDTSVIPFGTEVKINGHVYTAQDTGSAINGNRIDIYFENHQEALEFGVQTIEVFVEE
jgi:3D (Asp-Asp-Asp) domain-containing protein